MLSSNRALHSHNTQDGHTSVLSNQEMVVSALLCFLLYGSQTVKLNSSSTLICLYSLYILRSLQIATNLQLSHTLSLCVICHFTDRRWFCRWKQINYMWDMDIQFKDFFLVHISHCKGFMYSTNFCFSLSKNIYHVPKSYVRFSRAQESTNTLSTKQNYAEII